MSGLPMAAPRAPERYNFIGLDCPRCERKASLRIVAGLYDCHGCAARFKFLPETDSQLATLERVREDSAWNAGARIADDLRCFGCNARGHRHLCPSCQTEANRAGR